jgi:hypothetical protein
MARFSAVQRGCRIYGACAAYTDKFLKCRVVVRHDEMTNEALATTT